MTNENLIEETLISIEEYLPRLIAGCQKIAEQFRGVDEATAMQTLPAAFEGLEWLISAINELHKFGVLTNLDPQRITIHFPELEAALMNRDYILIGDLIEYEILPVLEEWYNK